jgi:hypothetical protein
VLCSLPKSGYYKNRKSYADSICGRLLYLPVLNTTIHTSIITIMDLLAQYADSDDEKNDQPQAGSDGLLAKLKMSINAAPIVKDDVVVCIGNEAISRGIINTYQKFKIIF